MKCYQWARSTPLEKKFNETHFLADIDLFFSQLKNQKTSGETLCEKEAAAKAYAKNVRQTPRDKAVEQTRKYLKNNGLLAVPFDKGVGFCIMRKQTYESKLESLLQSAQFLKKDTTTDEVILKIEKELNKELLAMNKRDEIIDQLYSKMRSTGGQPARLYSLALRHPYHQYYHFQAARMRILTKCFQSSLTTSMEQIWKPILKRLEKQLKTLL